MTMAEVSVMRRGHRREMAPVVAKGPRQDGEQGTGLFATPGRHAAPAIAGLCELRPAPSVRFGRLRGGCNPVGPGCRKCAPPSRAQIGDIGSTPPGPTSPQSSENG